jgi:3-(3-hydroxy-phenyl)propionate hydroxylase
MDDVVGTAPVLVTEPSLVPDLRLPTGVALITTEEAPDAAAHLARFGVSAALLRPDRYVFGTANTAEELADVLAALPLPPVNQRQPEMA